MAQRTATSTNGNRGASQASDSGDAASSARLRDSRWRKILRGLLLGMLLWLGWALSSLLPTMDRVDVVIGEASARDIRAPHQVSYVSEVETERARREAAAHVPDVYVGPDMELFADQVQLLREAIRQIGEVRAEHELADGEMPDSLPELAGVGLSHERWANILSLSDASWDLAARESERVLSIIMRDEIRTGDLPRARRDVQRIKLGILTQEEGDAVSALVTDLIVINTFLDPERTEELRDEARAGVEPVMRVIREGESIVREGEIVTESAYERLQVLGLLEPTHDWRQTVLELGFALLVVGVAMLYVARVDPLLIERPRRQLLLVVTLLIAGVSARILLPGQNLSPYLFPGAAAAMLIVLFMNIHYATLIAFVVSLAVGFSAGGSLPLALYVLLGSLVGALALMRTEQLSAFVPATGYVAIVNIATLLVMHAQIGTQDIRGILELAGVGLLNAVFSSSLCFVAYTFTGRLFGITTSIQLMELARPTHPLFRQLLIKAPGTYHHSILISNMAERAAEAIGGDILLTRVGSYYHDIGKTLRPHFYAENQSEGENPLDKLDPQTAAEIIIGHAAEGLELARRYRLPDKVRAFIPEHHGTTLVAYFYRKAVQEAGDHDVDEAAFRYPGPKPQSKETAILMLADAVEAWVRADRPTTEPELDRVIRQVINDRLIGGQLSETDLTLKDLDSIRQAFGDVLKGLYHPRIQYPERTSTRTERVANG